MLAAARLALTQQLAAAHGQQVSSSSSSQTVLGTSGRGLGCAAAAGFADAALAALPRLLDDAVLLRELMAKWNARVAGLWEAAEAQAKVGSCHSTVILCLLQLWQPLHGSSVLLLVIP
jgi:hypothetical protein